MSEGYGFGKVILFGEHFVVYGIPAIASAINEKTIAMIESADGFELVDNRNEMPGYKEKKKGQQEASLDYIFKAVGMERPAIRITLAGDLLAASGVGASAASCAAIARALSGHFKLNYDDKRINEIAHEGEKGYHGTPSGIDDTAATYGGLLWFRKGEPNTIELIKIREPVEAVMGYTGITADTKEVVADVRKRKEENPETFERIFREEEGLIQEARKALESFNLKRVGELMNKNQELLQEIGVSCKELDMLITTARENGAFGAKLTGTGRGGYMVALTPGKELQERVVKAIESKGFFALRIGIG
jgi:mevalonate kinase